MGPALLLLCLCGARVWGETLPVLPNVQSVTVTGRSDTQVSLQWKRVSSGSAPQYSYRLEFSNGTKTDSSITDTGEPVTAVVRQLTAGTRYSFSLYTVSEQGNTSSGFTFSTVTTLNCSSQSWVVTDSTVEGEIEGQFNFATALRGQEVLSGAIAGQRVSFSGLSPGCTYSVALFVQSGTQVLEQCSLSLSMDAAQVPEVTVHLLSSSELSVNWTSAPGCVRRYRASFAGPGRSFRTNTTATGLYFSGLRPGSRYTAGVITEGEGRDSAEVTGSGATSVLPNVQSVTVTGRLDTQVSLQWKRVSSGSAPQYSYRLEFSNGTKTDSSITDTGEPVTAVVRQLTAGTRYSFSLYTVSEQGNTSSGFTFSTVTTMDCSRQTWTTKGTIEGEIKGEFNLASAVRGEEVKTSKINKNKITFTDLSPGCSYTIFLYAQSGTQVLLQCSLNKTIDADPVSGVTVRPVKPGVLAASWPGARGCVKQYRVSVSGPALHTFTKTTTGTALDIPDLQPGCNYTVGVTTEGEGRDSTEVTSTAATDAPAVSQVTASPRGPHALVVSWLKAGGCVQGYVVYASGACSPERAKTAVDTTAVEVDDLRPGCTYTVAVATVGQGRNTSPNVTSTATTPPQTPKNVTVKDITGDRARISWEPITEGNYTGFEVTYTTSNGSSQMLNVSSTSVILEGLTPGENYSTSVSSYVMAEGTKIHSSAVTSHFQTVPAAKAYNPAVIAGVVIGGLVVFALIVFLIRRRKTRRFRRGGDDLADQLLD